MGRYVIFLELVSSSVFLSTLLIAINRGRVAKGFSSQTMQTYTSLGWWLLKIYNHHYFALVMIVDLIN